MFTKGQPGNPGGKPTVNGPLLVALVRRWAPTAAYVELVGPKPGEAGR